MTALEKETADPPILETKNLSVGYGQYVVLGNVEISLRGGEVVSLVGLNGTGKSTLLKTLIGTLPVLAGDMVLAGHTVTSWPAHRRIEAGVAFSPEGRRVFANMDVENNLLVGAASRPKSAERAGLAQVLELFPELSGRLTQRAGTLSGGEQQMLAIGRALMSAPRLLLVEEPSQGLAPVIVDRVYEALANIAAGGVAILIAEQFQQVREEASDRILVIDAGRVTVHSSSGRTS
ncbi:MAG: branched-chain amino acid ABC transporter ATP-binding protein [Sporichthyaceae bacterium]